MAFDGIEDVAEARKIVHERSETTGIGEDGVAKVTAQASFADDVDRDPKEICHVLLKPDEVEEASSWLHPHEQIEVTVWSGVASRIGAEDPQIDGTVPGTQSQDLDCVLVQLRNGHQILRRGRGIEPSLMLPPKPWISFSTRTAS